MPVTLIPRFEVNEIFELENFWKPTTEEQAFVKGFGEKMKQEGYFDGNVVGVWYAEENEKFFLKTTFFTFRAAQALNYPIATLGVSVLLRCSDGVRRTTPLWQ